MDKSVSAVTLKNNSFLLDVLTLLLQRPQLHQWPSTVLL